MTFAVTHRTDAGHAPEEIRKMRRVLKAERVAELLDREHGAFKAERGLARGALVYQLFGIRPNSRVQSACSRSALIPIWRA